MILPSRCTSGAARACLVGLALVVGACAAPSPRLDAEWIDRTGGPRPASLRGANVLVACEARDVAIRNICQDQLAAEVSARGAVPVFVAPDTQLTTGRPLDEQLLPGARTSDARAVLVVSLTPAVADAGGSGFSLGLGGFGFGRGSGVGGGVGVSAPLGGTRVETGYAANGRITDASTGRLVWSASAVAPPSADLDAQFGALSITVLDSAARAGWF